MQPELRRSKKDSGWGEQLGFILSASFHPVPGKSHGQRRLVGYSPWGHKESDTTEPLHFHSLSLFIRISHGDRVGDGMQSAGLVFAIPDLGVWVIYWQYRRLDVAFHKWKSRRIQSS